MNALIASIVAQENASGGGLAGLLPLLLIVPLFAWMFSQQRKQRRAAEELHASLAVGDEIVTTAGIYGTITFIEPDEPILHVAVDTDVIIRITKTSVARKVSGDLPDDPSTKAAR